MACRGSGVRVSYPPPEPKPACDAGFFVLNLSSDKLRKSSLPPLTRFGIVQVQGVRRGVLGTWMRPFRTASTSTTSRTISSCSFPCCFRACGSNGPFGGVRYARPLLGRSPSHVVDRLRDLFRFDAVPVLRASVPLVRPRSPICARTSSAFCAARRCVRFRSGRTPGPSPSSRRGAGAVRSRACRRGGRATSAICWRDRCGAAHFALASVARRTPGRRGAQASRNVRAPSGRVQDNVLSGQLEGKCHRNIPPFRASKGDRSKGEIVR